MIGLGAVAPCRANTAVQPSKSVRSELPSLTSPCFG